MKKDYLVLVRTFQGKSDPVLEQARKAGAKGGTVIHSRLQTDASRRFLKSFEISEEEEFVMILADAQTAEAVCRNLLEGQKEGQDLGTRIYLIPTVLVRGLTGAQQSF